MLVSEVVGGGFEKDHHRSMSVEGNRRPQAGFYEDRGLPWAFLSLAVEGQKDPDGLSTALW